MKENDVSNLKKFLNNLHPLLNLSQELCSGLQYLQTIVSCTHYHPAAKHCFLVFQVVVFVLLQLTIVSL